MPPVTRRLSKKVDPYYKENHQTEKRLALANINKVSISLGIQCYTFCYYHFK